MDQDSIGEPGRGRRRRTGVKHALHRVVALGVALIAVPVVAVPVAPAARACSCTVMDPLDAVTMADVVFTGTVVDENLDTDEPSWTFEVDGVVKGDVAPTEVVTAEAWAIGCGTDFGRFHQPIVVYAWTSGGRLRARGCMPTPTVDAFADRLAAVEQPTGTGAPAAVMVGTHALSDLAVLDGTGRTIARADLDLDAGAVAHCPGTTRVAVASVDSPAQVSIVELETLSVIAQRRLESGHLSVTGDRLTCLDGGARVVAASGYGPDEGAVVVAVSSTTDPPTVRRTFERASRAVVHPAGSVLLLPTTVGDPIRALSADDLEPTGAEIALPAGASTLDGDVSPDGSRLAVLATLSGRAVEWDTGATHVLTIELVDGIPVPESIEVLSLGDAGADIQSSTGAAKWIRWLDADTWIVESETVDTKKLQLIRTDGSQLLPVTDIGWGWGLVPLAAGVLRARDGGLEVVTTDGTAVDGDPAPSDEYIHRNLTMDRLVGAPAFELPPALAARLTIRPVPAVEAAGSEEPEEERAEEPGTSMPSEPEPPVAAGQGPIAGTEATPAEQADGRGGRTSPWLTVGVLSMGALLVACAVRVRRRGQVG